METVMSRIEAVNRMMAILADGKSKSDAVLPSPIITKDHAVKFMEESSIS